MRRHLYFNYSPAENNYIIQEDDSCVFRINGKTLKFVSLEFYNGIYAGNKSTAIDFENKITDESADLLNKGCYIFEWIKEIFKAIETELPEIEESEATRNEQVVTSSESMDDVEIGDKSKKVIPLFDCTACAGEGFYFDETVVPYENIEVKNENADYAVKISGKSMEPTISDGSVVMVQKVNELSNGDIGIFNINGQIMCKRYSVNGSSIMLMPDNKSGEFSDIDVLKVECIIQGKVILE